MNLALNLLHLKLYEGLCHYGIKLDGVEIEYT